MHAAPFTSLPQLRHAAGAGVGTCQRAMAAALLRSLMLLLGVLVGADLGAVRFLECSGSCDMVSNLLAAVSRQAKVCTGTPGKGGRDSWETLMSVYAKRLSVLGISPGAPWVQTGTSAAARRARWPARWARGSLGGCGLPACGNRRLLR